MKKYFLIFCLFISFSSINSQINSKIIYKKLLDSLNPNSVNENSWVISDAEMISNLYELLCPDEFNKNDIIERKVIIEIHMGQREIKKLLFKNLENENNTILYEIDDFLQLKNLLGDELYNTLLKKEYEYYNISTVSPPEKYSSEFMLDLNILNPSLMLNHFTSKNDHMNLFVEGKWGEDKIISPGWFSNEYMIGIRISNYGLNPLINQSLQKPKWSILVGTTFKKNHLITSNLPTDPLYNSGLGFNLSIKGQPSRLFSNLKYFENFEIELLSKFNFTKYSSEDFDFFNNKQIYSNKNYFGTFLKKYTNQEIIDFGYFNYGLGIMFYDIYKLYVSKNEGVVKDLEENQSKIIKYKTILSLSMGVEKLSSYWEHKFNITMNYEPNNKLGYIGFIFNFMVNNTIGVDIKFFRIFSGLSNIPTYRNDEYFVFSPHLRIGN